MLILTHRVGETVVIEPSPDIDPAMTVRELFGAGRVDVVVLSQRGRQTKIRIDAPALLNVVRSEQLQRSPDGE